MLTSGQPPTVSEQPPPARPESPQSEKRAWDRVAATGPVWWKGPQHDKFQLGWLVDRSPGGLAFLFKGNPSQIMGERLQLSTTMPTEPDFQVEEARVARVQHVYADVSLIAAQLRPRR